MQDFELPTDGNVSITIFDNSGRLVATMINEFKSAGYHTVNFNAINLASGAYFYRISSGTFTEIKRMVLIK